MPKEPWSTPTNPELRHLIAGPDGLCWWCGAKADSAEHKYKKTDLHRVKGAEDVVFWGSDGVALHPVRSLRKDPHVRFRPSLCQRCNNAASQPFDRAYDRFAEYVDAQMPDLWRMDGVPMKAVYGADWSAKTVDLARYYAKHFGCRLAEGGLTVPATLRQFLDGADDMPDAHLALLKLRSLKNMGRGFHSSLWLSDLDVWLTPDRSRITGAVMSNFMGYVGVRFEWHDAPWPHDSFFHYERPVLNHFNDASELMMPPIPRRRYLRSLNPRRRFTRHWPGPPANRQGT